MFKRIGFMVGIVALLTVFGGAAAQDSEPVQIIFMHHSTGLGVLEEGGVRQALTDLGYDFWDHGYNEEGLVNAAGDYLGINWDVPGDNTDPDGWYETFQQPVTDPPANTFSHMLQYDVIIFKSCFPTSDIYDEDMLAAYQHYYLTIRDVIDQHPDKLFIPWTPPPLVPNSTTAENAVRARRWADYLTSPEYLDGHPNIAVFDFFTLMADEQGFLSKAYRPDDEWDSHPNTQANQMAGPVFVAFVDQAVRDFVPGAASSLAQPESVTTALVPGDMIDDFEGDSAAFSDRWWIYGDAGVRIETFGQVAPGYDSPQALGITFTSPAQYYGGFGMSFDSIQDWSHASGISFYWQASQPGLLVNVYITGLDPQDMETSSPLVVEATPPVGEWEQITLLWADFARPDWVGDYGLDALDPIAIRDINFGFGDWEKALDATLMIDNIHLVTGE